MGQESLSIPIYLRPRVSIARNQKWTENLNQSVPRCWRYDCPSVPASLRPDTRRARLSCISALQRRAQHAKVRRHWTEFPTPETFVSVENYSLGSQRRFHFDSRGQSMLIIKVPWVWFPCCGKGRKKIKQSHAIYGAEYKNRKDTWNTQETFGSRK